MGASGAGSSIKPEITFCMVNGARMLNGLCYNSRYSEGSASADYFITDAAIHVLNGEVKLGYYNDGSGVYNKIAALVSYAENYNRDEYDEATGTTKSIAYAISPKKTEWQDMGDGLYRSKEKFVRTKTGSITNVSYKITGQPDDLTVGELKTDASEIEDDSGLKKYDNLWTVCGGDHLSCLGRWKWKNGLQIWKGRSSGRALMKIWSWNMPLTWKMRYQEMQWLVIRKCQELL